MDDNKILDLFFQREENAIEVAKLKYGGRLYSTAMNILNSKEDAEECVNDTLFKVWGVIPPQRPKFLGAFLAKITRNLALNKWEARGAAKRGGTEVNLMLSELGDCIPSSGGTEVDYEGGLVIEAINGYLGSMDQNARITFVRRYFYGDSISIISQNFNMTESKIKSMLFRARKKLKTHLEKEGIVL